MTKRLLPDPDLDTLIRRLNDGARDLPEAAEGEARDRLAAQAAALTWPGGMTAAEFAASISDATYAGFISSNWSVLAGWRIA